MLAALRQRPTEGVYRLSTLPGSDDQSPVALLPRSRQHGGLSGRLGLGVNGAVEGDHAKLLRVDRLTVSANGQAGNDGTFSLRAKPWAPRNHVDGQWRLTRHPEHLRVRPLFTAKESLPLAADALLLTPRVLAQSIYKPTDRPSSRRPFDGAHQPAVLAVALNSLILCGLFRLYRRRLAALLWRPLASDASSPPFHAWCSSPLLYV